ncbi:MAG: DUF948 domain-containing protein [Cyanobacteria bacterium P01_H01_bin.121]
MDPLFWLGLSLFLVAVSLAAVLIALIPAVQELTRAARSAERLFDTLYRELPPTLDSIRMTGLEITELTDDMTESVKSAGEVARQVDDSLNQAKQHAQTARIATRSVAAGVRAAWTSLTRPVVKPRPQRSPEQLAASDRPSVKLESRAAKSRSRSDNYQHTDRRSESTQERQYEHEPASSAAESTHQHDRAEQSPLSLPERLPRELEEVPLPDELF